jgi:hypothetical protein
LRDGCHHCGEADPLHFGTAQNAVCWSCGEFLTDVQESDDVPVDRAIEAAVQNAYSAALQGVAPDLKLLGKTTHREFRHFVDSMLQLLGRWLDQHPCEPTTGTMARQDLLSIIVELIVNAAPSTNVKQRRERRARGLVLWAILLKLPTREQGLVLDRISEHWPLALRRRLSSAMLLRRRKRWPYNPYSAQHLSLRFKCHAVAVVYDLSATKSLQGQQSTI